MSSPLQAKVPYSFQMRAALWGEARKKEISNLYDAIGEIEELATVDDRFKDISEPLISIVSYADKEASNGQGRGLPDLIALLLDLAGRRSDSERREAIGVFAELAEEILDEDEEEKVFISTMDLLEERLPDIEELSWIPNAKALATFLSKFDLTPQRDTKGQSRGYWITRGWVNEVKSRYLGLIPSSEPSEPSEPSEACI